MGAGPAGLLLEPDPRRPAGRARRFAGAAQAAHPSRTWPVPAILAGLLLLALLPLAAGGTPPFFDYLNHLSRVHIMANRDETVAFAEWFRPASLMIPNVGADVVLLGLVELFGTEPAGRLFVLMLCAGTFGGVLALSCAVSGRLSPWPAFASLALFHEMLFWGFLNYALGIALLLLGLAAWLALEGRSRAGQFACGTASALLVFFSHLVAFGLFALAIAALELRRAWNAHGRARAFGPALARLSVSAAIFVPPLLLFALPSPSGGLPAAPHFNFSPFEKLAPFTRLLSSGNPAGDAAVLLAGAGLLAGLAATGRVRLDPRLGAVAATFLVAQALMPYTVMQSFFVDNRVAVATVLVTLAGLSSTQRGERAEGAGWTCLALLLALRSALLVAEWRAADAEYRGIADAFEAIPRGSLILAGTRDRFEYGTGWFFTRSRNPPHEHTASLATIRRDAIAPAVFAKPGQNPLVFHPLSDTARRISLGPIPRLGSRGEFVRMARLATEARGDLDAAGRRWEGVYVVAFRVPCEAWPRDVPLRTVACGRDVSILAPVRGAKPARSRLR